MGRHLGPKAKLCRKFGENIFGSPKYDKILKRKGYAPGEHGQSFRRRKSDYAVHLAEKQRIRFQFGLMEKQFVGYFKKAAAKKGITGENLLQMLEMRLDNIVYRLGLSITRMQARQLVSHGHIQVDGKKVNIPSFICRQGNVVQVREKSKNLNLFIENIGFTNIESYPWLSLDKKNLKGEVLSIPSREQIPIKVDERLIIEYYSK